MDPAFELSVALRYRRLSFERAARTYDGVAGVQRFMARRLVELLPPGWAPRHVLELGAGTGNLSLLLRERCSQSRLVVTDVSGAMLEVARRRIVEAASASPCSVSAPRGAHFVELDASGEHWGLRGRFGLLASNAVVQWFPDLRRHLVGARGRLRPAGRYLLSGFLPDNLPELASILECFGSAPRVGHSEDDVLEACRTAGLVIERFEPVALPQRYSSARAFFEVLRTMGASRYPGRRPLGRSQLLQIMNEYEARNGDATGVNATWRAWYALILNAATTPA